MTCESCRDSLMDVLYGEDIGSEACYDFFKHLQVCRDCDSEFQELLDTREVLGLWNMEAPEIAPPVVLKEVSPGSRLRQFVSSGWPLLQRIAAGILILVGAISIMQSMGFWQSEKVLVSEQQLLEMVNDMIVLRQAEERKIIGQALVNFADEVALKQQDNLHSVDGRITTLERRYLDNIEQTNHYLKTLLSR